VTGLPVPEVAPRLLGDGVLLTPWEDTDLPRIVELADEEGGRWSRSLAGMRSVDDARRWLDERRGPDRVDWAVRDPTTRVLIGRTSLHRLTDRPPSGGVGYGVHPSHRRRGVAAAAVGTAGSWAFAELGLRRVERVHDVHNVASCGVANRCGFAHEGLERSALGYPDGRVGDQHRHARLDTDPAAPASPAPRPLDPVSLDAGHLRLRPWRDSDADAVLTGLSDPLTVRWNPRLPLRDVAAARAWIAERARRWTVGRAASWAVTGTDDTVVGSVALREIDRVDARAVASYWTLPAARGGGVAADALTRATAYALGDLGLHRIELAHAVDNTASCRVAAKAAFALEATLRQSNLLAAGFADEHVHARLAAGA
jgi:RimJ/RimL family protein N-acetyltransferase